MMLPSIYLANSSHQGGTPRCRALSQPFVDLEHEAIPCVSSGDDSPLSASSHLLSSRGFGALLLRRERRPLVEMVDRPRTVSSTGEVAAEPAASAPRDSEGKSNRRDGSEETGCSHYVIVGGGTGCQALEHLLSRYDRTARTETATRPMPTLPRSEASNPDVPGCLLGLDQAALKIDPSRTQDLGGTELLDVWWNRRQADCLFHFVGHGPVDAPRVGGLAAPARDLERRHTDSLEGTTSADFLRPRDLWDQPDDAPPDDAPQSRAIFLLDICNHGAVLTFPMTQVYPALNRYGLVGTMTGMDVAVVDSCSAAVAAGAITDRSPVPRQLWFPPPRHLLVLDFGIMATAIVDRSLLSIRPDGEASNGHWIASVRQTSASHPWSEPTCLVRGAFQRQLWRAVFGHDEFPPDTASGDGACTWSPRPFHSNSVTRKLPQCNGETAVRFVATASSAHTCVPSSAVVSRRDAAAEAVNGSSHESWSKRWPTVLERTTRLLRRLRDRLHPARRAPTPLWALILHGRRPRHVDDPATELVTFVNEILETRACRLARLPSIDALSLRNLQREFLGEWLCRAPTDQQLFQLDQGAARASANWAVVRTQLVQGRPHQRLVWTPREQAGFFLNRVLSYWAAARGSHSAGLVDLGGFVGASRLAWRLVSGHRSHVDILRGSRVPASAPADLHSLSRRLALKLGIEVWEHDLKDLEGCLVVSRRRSVIHVGNQLPPDRRAWVICHELAHGVLCGKIRLKDYRIRHLHRPNSSYGLDPELLQGKPRESDRFQRQEREAEALASLLVHHLDGLIELWSADSRLSEPSALERTREGQRHSPLVVAEGEDSWKRWAAIPYCARDRVREVRKQQGPERSALTGEKCAG